MSELITAARPYARAVFASASESNSVDAWSDVLNFCAALSQDAKMQMMLANPSLNLHEAAALFIEVSGDQLNDHAKNFIKILAENDRLVLLPEINQLFQDYRSQSDGAIEAELIAAMDVGEAQLSAIQAALSERLGKKVTLTSRIDESLIGGAIIQAGDTVIDGSVRGQLEKLATTLVN